MCRSHKWSNAPGSRRPTATTRCGSPTSASTVRSIRPWRSSPSTPGACTSAPASPIRSRAILGIGAGISGFVELGIVRKKPAVAMREAIHVIRALLKGEAVDFHGDVVGFNNGKLSFKPVRAEIPVYVASNGPLGQRMTGGVADGAIMEGCGNVEEVN